VDLSFNTEYELFRQEVIQFLKSNWPVADTVNSLSKQDKEAHFRQQAIRAGY
jgi:hypothetical protein